MSDSSRMKRLSELLADRALGGLTSDDVRELERLGAKGAIAQSFERAAAAVHMAFLGDELDPLPDDLRARVSRVLTEG